MKTRRLLLCMLTAMIIVVGCGGTGYEQSSTLIFSMSVLQVEGEHLIQGTVYNDLNGDGVRDVGEPGVLGAVVTLVGIGEKTTGSDGLFAFGVQAGAYTVHETDPPGYISTTDNEFPVVVEAEDVQVDFGDYIDPGLPVDVKPGSDVNPLNLKSNGVLPVAICGSETFDVAQINPDSLRLNGVAPLRWSYEDVCGQDDTSTDPGMNGDDEEMPDGYEDMTLKFNTQDIAGTLGEVWRGKIETLTMVGFFLEGSSISGEETVRIVQVPK